MYLYITCILMLSLHLYIFIIISMYLYITISIYNFVSIYNLYFDVVIIPFIYHKHEHSGISFLSWMIQ